MSLKQTLARTARELGLLGAAEQIRYRVHTLRFRGRNARFVRANPELAVPPSEVLYDIQGNLNYEAFFRNGKLAAEYYLALFDELFPGRATLDVCEWGCGPARILRWLARLSAPARLRLSGCDYNARAIAWCRANLDGIDFRPNGIAPPAPFPDGAFDVLYSVSVYTHLSEAMHHAWFRDNLRVVRPGGCIILSVHGDAHREKLLPGEQTRYDSGELVVRESVVEGSRLYAAFQSPRFVRERLLSGVEIVRHDRGASFTDQDIWVVRKP